MKKVSALFLAVAMAASVNVQAASFLDWLLGRTESPVGRGLVGPCVCNGDPHNPCGYCGGLKKM